MKKLITFIFIVLGSVQIASAEGEVKRILVVPGHDDDYSGALFGGMREVDLNRKVANLIVQELSKIEGVEVINAHDDDGYASFLEKYFKKESKKIDAFIKKSKKDFAKKVKKGDVEVETAVPHGTATPTSAKRLYGINKWANENDVDLVLHIHFNDYGARSSVGGMYNGFSVYVAHSELQNGDESIQVGKDVYNSLHEIFLPSNNPTEAKYKSAIEDHELIALGANNSLTAPSVLIEYSYIYEPNVQAGFFDRVAEEFAHRTVIGLSDFLGNSSSAKAITSYTWSKDIGEENELYPSLDVYMLQLALRGLDLYPVGNYTQANCPVTGVLSPCTKEAIKAFQKSKGLTALGYFGPQTRNALNAIF